MPKFSIEIVIPIAFSFYIEGLMFETSTIVAMYFPLNDGQDKFLQLDVHVAVGNTSTFFFYIGLGVNIAASVFVGINMGARKVTKA